MCYKVSFQPHVIVKLNYALSSVSRKVLLTTPSTLLMRVCIMLYLLARHYVRFCVLFSMLFITFCISRRRRKMYCGTCVCVCVCVCLSAAVCLRYCMDPDVTWGHGRGCPLVVHYWADLQSGHGLRCYGSITRTLVTSLDPFRDMTT